MRKTIQRLTTMSVKMDGRCRYCGSEKYRVTRFGKTNPQGRSGFPGCLLVHHRGFNDWSSLLNEEYKLFIADCWRRKLPCRWTINADRHRNFANRRSLEGELRYRKWQAFKQMLKDLSPMKRIEDLPSIQLWDHFLFMPSL